MSSKVTLVPSEKSSTEVTKHAAMAVLVQSEKARRIHENAVGIYLCNILGDHIFPVTRKVEGRSFGDNSALCELHPGACNTYVRKETP
jgi:hypothetical protein